MSYFNAIKQNVVADPLNSSVANIASGAFFRGLAVSTLGVAGIQVSLKASHNCHVEVEQSPGLVTATGTVTTNGTANLVGSGTNFLSRKVGDQILVDGETIRTIDSISSDTVLTVSASFATTGGSKAYQMYEWDIVDVYDFVTSLGNFGVTVQSVNFYVRVSVTNLGSATTTYFRLQTALCPIVEAVPRALDEHGYLKVGVKSIGDGYGFEAECTPYGELRTATPVRLVGARFEGSTVDANFWTATNANNGTATQANGEMTLATNTPTANGATSVQSARRARYVGGVGMLFTTVVQLGNLGVTSNVRRWGIGYGASPPTITDGAWFQLSGTIFSIVTMKGGAPTTVSSGAFNGVLGTTYTLTTDALICEIYWTTTHVYFVIGGDLLHTVTAVAATWANTMLFHAFADNTNASGVATNQTLTLRRMAIYRLGLLWSQPISRYQSGTTAGVVCKYGAGNLHSLTISSVTSGSVITLYDNTSAATPVIWAGTITFGNQGGNGIYQLDFKGLPFFTGLTLVIATQNANVLVVYE